MHALKTMPNTSPKSARKIKDAIAAIIAEAIAPTKSQIITISKYIPILIKNVLPFCIFALYKFPTFAFAQKSGKTTPTHPVVRFPPPVNFHGGLAVSSPSQGGIAVG